MRIQGLQRRKSAASCESKRKDLMYARIENEYQVFLLAGTLQPVSFSKEKLFSAGVGSGVSCCWYLSLCFSLRILEVVLFQHALFDQHRQIMFLISGLFAALSKFKKNSQSLCLLVYLSPTL